MGMAASQARFLGLTARKTNTEYEGQQVNQQRTALANESASLYNRLVSLSVPTPPSQYDYYKDSYTFDYDGNEYTMKEIIPIDKDNNTYNVTAKYVESTAVASYKPLAQVGLVSLPKEASGTTAATNGVLTVNGNPCELLPAATNPELVSNWNTNHSENPLAQGSKFYSYTNESTGVVSYIPVEFLTKKNGEDYDYTGQTIEKVDSYYNTTQSVTKYQQFNGVKMYKDEDGNYYNISITDSDGKTTSCTTTATNQMDSEAYDTAMNQYTVAYNRYEQEMESINAKTENIQQQDKTLELRLKQLDTEQSALQTELEAVSKVIDKNVESTFKTFA